jgi:S-ribosylhomocysteine lyase
MIEERRVMVDVSELGWEARTTVELDHRRLKAPHVKLRSISVGPKGDSVYCIDLRVSRPNVEYMTQTELHSMEHFLLAGFQKYLPENFISVGPMGCRTGFYLVLFNEGRADRICTMYENILRDVLTAKEVPYANLEQCGNYKNHSLKLVQKLARRLLAAKDRWRQVV